MNVSLRQFRAFLAVARLQSFTRASTQLHISQAGLSAMMREMEEQLGCRLFDRTTRQVALTEAGTQFRPFAERAVAEIEGGAALLNKSAAMSRQRFSVAVSPVIGLSLLPSVCAIFNEEHPEITITVHDVAGNQVQSMVENGEADIGFGAFRGPMTGIERVLMFRCSLLYVAKAGIFKTSGRSGTSSRSNRMKTLAWSKLPDVPVYANRYGNRPPDAIDESIDTQLKAVGRNGSRPMLGYLHTAIGMTAAGIGSAIVPSYALPACRALGADVARLVEPEVTIDFHRITRKGRELPHGVELFIETLTDVAAGLWEQKPE